MTIIASAILGGGVSFALLLGFDNPHTTPSKIPLLDRKSFVVVVVVVYAWRSPNITLQLH